MGEILQLSARATVEIAQFITRRIVFCNFIPYDPFGNKHRRFGQRIEES